MSVSFNRGRNRCFFGADVQMANRQLLRGTKHSQITTGFA